ncbi:heterogeneous nuclear ribonucleoprotein 87F-like [Helianthus annuus]|uniref:heterogeneous nuclear ribonucleoprotein 87F-like n=1 Tax=Helianthus annuus TaxID=4232 RepID=UPI000B8F0C12|nr:heterogeneous nuclear ribonucleoprotein 87F-like [Helianthus annuus]
MNPNFQSGNQGGQGGSSYHNRQGGNQGGYQRNYNQGGSQGYQNRENNYQRGYNQGGNGGGASNSQTDGDDSINSNFDALMNAMNALTTSNQEIKFEMKKEFEVRDKLHGALAKQVGQLA